MHEDSSSSFPPNCGLPVAAAHVRSMMALRCPSRPPTGTAEIPMRTPRVLLVAVAALAGCASSPTTPPAAPAAPAPGGAPTLGAFSISLAVKDLAASRAFYEKLGFVAGHGDGTSWSVLRNGDTVIGLFQGVIPKNSLTFNPGWTQQATPLSAFTDVREIQALLLQRGLSLTAKADPASTGPAYLMLMDPDGNPVLIDQHVQRPK